MMQLDQLLHNLDSPEEAKALLSQLHLRDIAGGLSNVRGIADAIGLETFSDLCHPLSRILPRVPDPDMSLNNLERFFANPAAPAQLPLLLETRARTLETLLQLFSTSQFFSDLLVSNPDYLDMLRVPLRSSPSRDELQDQLQAEVDAAFEDSAVLRAFRRFRQRQMLRIGTNDIIRDRPFEEVTRDISRVADMALEVALNTAIRTIKNRFGEPFTTKDQPARCVIMAFGKHGGKELNYSSDIDLMFLFDDDGATRGKRLQNIGNDEFYARVVGEFVRLLSQHSEQGTAYRVDLRLRPEGKRGPLARSLTSTLAYYDTMGRTWERQALIKVRPCAGDIRLGDQFVKTIEPFVYRKYLTSSEINGIKALKRRIEQKSHRDGTSGTEVKTGIGGIRDVEFAIQFLQLLNGGDLPEVRQKNTLRAMQALAQVGCLTEQEYGILQDTYRFLRRVEHRLQLMCDLQTHRLPDSHEELRKLAQRMGFTDQQEDGHPSNGLDAFLTEYRAKTELNRKILDHLLHQTFEGEAGEPESDLILDPNPDPATVQAVLGKYPFRDVDGAYQCLTQLATESVPFLSTRRCRHFLASIAPSLLKAIAETPDPDMALVNLEKVTATLGGKAILWELFSFNPPSLKLYVELCASSQFLSEILITNPGMIDELLDSLVLNQPRSLVELKAELADLCRNAADPDPILHSFQDKEILRIGVRDILGKDDIQATTAALSDVAETILGQLAEMQQPPMNKRFGIPHVAETGQPARYALLGLGKLGGREMSYQSDLDLILVYEGDGRTAPPPGSTRFDHFELTENFHFFTEFTQRIIKSASLLGPMGRLYHVDMRLRPTGKSGSLVIPLSEFRRYYESGGAQLWERQALTRARVVHGDDAFGCAVMAAVEEAVHGIAWQPQLADEILSMRERVQASGSERDLKRGFGGISDVEFLVQLFRIKYGKNVPALRTTNTWEALDALGKAGLISAEELTTLRTCYDFLREVEACLRIVHNRSLDELPNRPEDLERLARRMGSTGAAFRGEL
ncbi:MAG TPA: bifunctional [glutamate--ammonia ligase]-adenylyl-L-tyrosine phosphorylase/[glutamate--ammonia-ligase] adenylyltransferase, partial [Gemmataceae bacterium]|nr:bifunctional [glutamate--ammonia ligase]-adenylyl-L-tyrosine phosphorylase/[glutamate--ammonia-ligase] adenylyltransferase [Gemmataceae bacterium]